MTGRSERPKTSPLFPTRKVLSFGRFRHAHDCKVLAKADNKSLTLIRKLSRLLQCQQWK